MKKFFVYILTSEENGTLYTGVTSNLGKRIYQHKNKEIKGFTSKYNVNKLVYCEEFEEAEPAIKREKAIKKWNRAWKLQLINETNPKWIDLFEDNL